MSSSISIALIGYGRMGKEIESIALSRGHKISAKIAPAVTGEDFNSSSLSDTDVAIEFTTPEAAFNNYIECFKRNIPVVSGTTGWLDKIDEIKSWCSKKGQTFFYAPNFSIGVNILFELNQHLSKIMNTQTAYDVNITEIHHTKKLDAPSGTAIALAKDIAGNMERKTKWELNKQSDKESIKIDAIRENNVPGTHTIKYDSEADEIILHHRAKSRKGFALGAVMAAELTVKNKGFLTMKDLLKF